MECLPSAEHRKACRYQEQRRGGRQTGVELREAATLEAVVSIRTSQISPRQSPHGTSARYVAAAGITTRSLKEKSQIAQLTVNAASKCSDVFAVKRVLQTKLRTYSRI